MAKAKGALYGWTPEIKPELNNLESRARDAIFWRDIRGIQSCKTLSPKRIKVSLGNSIGDSLWFPLKASLTTSLQYSLRESVREFLGKSLWPMYGESFYYPLGFALADDVDEAAKFKNLHQLFLAGNIPLGFDKRGKLLVLVAD